MNSIDFLKLIHETSGEEKEMAYKQATDIITELQKTEGVYDTDAFIHYCIFRTCLLDIKITHLLTLVLEVSKK